MQKFMWIIAIVLTAAIAAPNAHADSFTFTGSGPGMTMSGTMTATPGGPNQFTVTAITGNVNGDPITGIIPGGPGAFTSPGNAYSLDNVLYFPSAPFLDGPGIGFYVNGTEANVFFVSDPGSYYLLIGNRGHIVESLLSVFSVSSAAPVPEPASLFLLGSGLLGLVGRVRTKLS